MRQRNPDGGGERGDVRPDALPCPQSPGPGGGAEPGRAAVALRGVTGRAPAPGWSWKERVLGRMRFYF